MSNRLQNSCGAKQASYPNVIKTGRGGMKRRPYGIVLAFCMFSVRVLSWKVLFYVQREELYYISIFSVSSLTISLCWLLHNITRDRGKVNGRRNTSLIWKHRHRKPRNTTHSIQYLTTLWEERSIQETPNERISALENQSSAAPLPRREPRLQVVVRGSSVI